MVVSVCNANPCLSVGSSKLRKYFHAYRIKYNGQIGWNATVPFLPPSAVKDPPRPKSLRAFSVRFCEVSRRRVPQFAVITRRFRVLNQSEATPDQGVHLTLGPRRRQNNCVFDEPKGVPGERRRCKCGYGPRATVRNERERRSDCASSRQNLRDHTFMSRMARRSQFSSHPDAARKSALSNAIQFARTATRRLFK
jgi:hypothetical protein